MYDKNPPENGGFVSGLRGGFYRPFFIWKWLIKRTVRQIKNIKYYVAAAAMVAGGNRLSLTGAVAETGSAEQGTAINSIYFIFLIWFDLKK